MNPRFCRCGADLVLVVALNVAQGRVDAAYLRQRPLQPKLHVGLGGARLHRARSLGRLLLRQHLMRQTKSGFTSSIFNPSL